MINKKHTMNSTAKYISLSIPIILLLSLTLSSFTRHSLLFAQPIDEKPQLDEEYSGHKDTKTSLLTLLAIIESIETIQDGVDNKEKELDYIQAKEQRNKITNEIIELNAQIRELKRDFEKIATGVDLETTTPEQKRRFDWQEEVQVLLGPLIREMRNLTAHPRAIEKLRGEVDYYEKRLPFIKNGINNTQSLIEETKNPKLKEQLIQLKKNWENKQQHLTNQLTIARYHLNEKLKGKKSFLETAQGIIRVFFLSRGLNLILCVLAFIFVWMFLSILYKFLFKDARTKMAERYSFYYRLINVLYHVFTFLAATSALILVLYIMGDWVLLLLVLIFLFGLAWAARHTIPIYWTQGKLLLNLGSVKEKERLIYNGIPWEVYRLNFSTQLINPLLTGGLIRLPLEKLVGLLSRPYEPDEPWFPCKENDWVILSDGTHGKVVIQTPDIVELILLGGSRKTYSTQNFLNLNPNNISTNFRIYVTFGIDYTHQAISTTQIPESLKVMLIEELGKRGYAESIINLDVEFKEAGASSLDLEILADFSGKVAGDYYVLSRLIQQISVDACNRYGWIIPFTQITLHSAETMLNKD